MVGRVRSGRLTSLPLHRRASRAERGLGLVERLLAARLEPGLRGLSTLGERVLPRLAHLRERVLGRAAARLGHRVDALGVQADELVAGLDAGLLERAGLGRRRRATELQA